MDRMRGRGCKSLDIRRNFDVLDRRRSAELSRSTRRYDEHWGAAERSDARIKCSDGLICHCHSQIIATWSPVLRDMIDLYPTHHLVESTHGLAYLLHVEEDSAVWTAVLDMMYPVPAKPLDWLLLERCLLLTDKFAMYCLLQRLSSTLTDPRRTFSMDPGQPNFALKWLGLAERLQLLQVVSYIQEMLKPCLSELGNQPAAMAAVLAYAKDNCSKEQLLQLLQISMEAAQQPQQQQQQQHAVMLLLQQQQGMSRPPMPPATVAVRSGQAISYHQHQMSRHPELRWPAAATSCSGTSSPASCDPQHLLSDEASSEQGDSQQQQREQAMAALMAVDTCAEDDQQRMALCLSSGLFAPAVLPQRGQQQVATLSRAASPALSCTAATCSSSAACAPATASAPSAGPRQQQQQQQQQPVFAMQVDARAGVPSFGFVVNAGSTSIADWMMASLQNDSSMQCA